MHAPDWLAEQFEKNRGHLRAVAYRMLGSLHEADDAVQETWLKLSRSGANDVENLSGWLTTVVARVCQDILRSRNVRHADSVDTKTSKPVVSPESGPEQEAILAQSVGLALLVVLGTLAPAERLAFVLHDMFATPFEEIAVITGRTPAAARQLASRARRRVQGSATPPNSDLAGQRAVVDAFLAAARAGDFTALLAVLDPDVVLRSDAAALPLSAPDAPSEVRGAQALAKRAIAGGAQAAQPALVNGAVGVIVAPHGRLLMVLRFTIEHGKVLEIDAVMDPERLRQLDLSILQN